jgi:hypothetical protein
MRLAALLAIALCSACGVVRQPESARTVAAYEVPLPTPQQRDEFFTIVREAAEAEGLHVDAPNSYRLKRLSEVGPITVRAAVWRGANDDDPVASVIDPPERGRTWISFSHGEDPALAKRFRERAIREILDRWPNAQSLPIMPTGAIPLAADLRLTTQGYRVDRSAAPRYDLPPSSPLIAIN